MFFVFFDFLWKKIHEFPRTFIKFQEYYRKK